MNRLQKRAWTELIANFVLIVMVTLPLDHDIWTGLFARVSFYTACNCFLLQESGIWRPFLM